MPGKTDGNPESTKKSLVCYLASACMKSCLGEATLAEFMLETDNWSKYKFGE